MKNPRWSVLYVKYEDSTTANPMQKADDNKLIFDSILEVSDFSMLTGMFLIYRGFILA
jgi:hypothetical protein